MWSLRFNAEKNMSVVRVSGGQLHKRDMEKALEHVQKLHEMHVVEDDLQSHGAPWLHIFALTTEHPSLRDAPTTTSRHFDFIPSIRTTLSFLPEALHRLHCRCGNLNDSISSNAFHSSTSSLQASTLHLLPLVQAQLPHSPFCFGRPQLSLLSRF